MERNVDILLIEDNHFEAELTIHALEKNKLANNLKHINNSEEALEFIFCRGRYKQRQNCPQPKLILLDLKLPKIDGLQILKQIKSDVLTKAIPVIILTCSQQEIDIIESYNLGANSYLVKSVNFHAFEKSVTEMANYWLTVNQTRFSNIKL